MADTSDVKLTITFTDPDLDAEEKDKEVQKLLAQMKDLDEVEAVDRVINSNAPEGSKSVTGWVVAQLISFVKPENVKQVWGFLSDRLGNKLIEVEAEANGKKIKIKASSRQELEAAVKAIQELVETE
ncbi:hypothetical protein SAMD00079811_49070 [Scytonema sp. HK-05]|uniref:hypothetical protein n=1 Tax=Scytonema sp. HK-05 TaxID=1137095 RepID=UPI000936586A|nr:hypothetical protein [Scytonema sp. HK-05]OKH57323.1 hypothetical protein NIES2130_20300 [Scytonema sp. HK-05]BAY47290.1 hypothetical protein SAMD00079811_49070 [Scytonema sp. HK-05]